MFIHHTTRMQCLVEGSPEGFLFFFLCSEPIIEEGDVEAEYTHGRDGKYVLILVNQL